MLKTINAKMLEQNAHAVNYIKVRGLKDATGKIKDINHQINRDFGLAGPFTITTPSARVHAVRWAMARECLVVENEVSRVTKEIVAAAIAQINQCPYCEDVHGASIASAGDNKTAESIINGTWKNGEDERVKSIIEWSLNTRNPDADIIRNPPFSKKEAPEIIGTALAFHSTNRLVSIFLDETPMPGILGNDLFRKTALTIASKTLFKSMISKKASSGDATQFIKGYPQNENEYSWHSHIPSFSVAISAQNQLLQSLEDELVPFATAQIFKEAINNWSGEEMPLGRAWLKAHLDKLDTKEHPVAQLLFLAAFAPYTITGKEIEEFRRIRPSDKELIEVCFGSIQKLTNKISEWLTEPFN